MPTNDERREAARKLRERYGERSIDFVGQGMMSQLETLVQDIRDCIPKGRTLLVLADLIDPDNPDETGRPLSDPEIDRERLLALADEMESEGLEGWASGPVNVGEFARRIREAVGA